MFGEKEVNHVRYWLTQSRDKEDDGILVTVFYFDPEGAESDFINNRCMYDREHHCQNGCAGN